MMTSKPMTRTPFAKRYLRALLVIVYTLFAHPLLADVKTLAGGRLSITIQHTDVAEVFEMLSRPWQGQHSARCERIRRSVGQSL